MLLDIDGFSTELDGIAREGFDNLRAALRGNAELEVIEAAKLTLQTVSKSNERAANENHRMQVAMKMATAVGGNEKDLSPVWKALSGQAANGLADHKKRQALAAAKSTASGKPETVSGQKHQQGSGHSKSSK